MRLYQYLLPLAVVGCCATTPAGKYPEPNAADLERMTVSFIKYHRAAHISMNDAGDLEMTIDAPEKYSYCSGTWVSRYLVLTAGHCAGKDAKRGDRYRIETRSGDEVVLEFLDAGAHDDMALLRAIEDPGAHPFATLGDEPKDGEQIQAVGHPHPDREMESLDWTYMSGWVSSYRPLKEEPLNESRPAMQMQIPVYYGMSGGGVFNMHGQLVGMTIAIEPAWPAFGYAVPAHILREFLDR